MTTEKNDAPELVEQMDFLLADVREMNRTLERIRRSVRAIAIIIVGGFAAGVVVGLIAGIVS